MTNFYYIFSIIDDGLLLSSTMMFDSELANIIEHAERTLKEYLDENGFEGSTDDGYCKVVCLLPGVAAEHVFDEWNFSFDGELTITEALESLKRKDWRLAT
ncbi:hypothetical protein J6TS7_29520 [Paenibacillus dendritiformis]|uniref:hypothetical protein n=1 Tax=Paenibacillus TaxID=44249 RepID=UPI001B171E08|nr:hypothetical protein [Paenibacillus dendritiformis]GIO79342.1 hypothetical protein J6TS7_29520 [Paenibacillus dendritiformis]